MFKHKSAKSGSSSGYPSAGPEGHIVSDEIRTRCPCGSCVETGTMIQVVDFYYLCSSVRLLCVSHELFFNEVEPVIAQRVLCM